MKFLFFLFLFHATRALTQHLAYSARDLTALSYVLFKCGYRYIISVKMNEFLDSIGYENLINKFKGKKIKL